MANLPFFFSAIQSVFSDPGAAEREVEAYLNNLSSRPSNDPEGLFPFSMDKQGALTAFSKWLHSLRMVPGGLKRTADLGSLKAVWVPFWAINSMTYSNYRGEKGKEEKETEEYTDAAGEAKTREVTKVRYEPVAGEVRHHFDNLSLYASNSLPDAQLPLLVPRDWKNLKPYSPDAAKDVPVQPCSLNPRSGFNKARDLMAGEIRKKVEKDIGGKEPKVSKVETRHVGVAMKLFLVPAYEGSYRFGGKDYKVLINGATGEVTGDYPVSAGKIIMLILIILAVIAAIFGALYFFVIKPRQHAEGPNEHRPALVKAKEADLSVRERLRETVNRLPT
jgi:hypothetical protein